MKPYKPMKGLLAAAQNAYKKYPSKLEGGDFAVTVDCDPIPTYAELLRDIGVTGVFLCGTTGDFSVLSCEERLQVQEAWLAAEVRAKFDHVIVHIGSSVWADMIRLGEHASGRGASAVAVTLPSFKHHAPQSANQVIQYLDRVSHALPDMPLLIYNIEGATPPHLVNNLYPIVKEALENNKIPTLVGLKYTSPNFMDAFEILTQSKLDVGIGCDEKLLAALGMGFKSFIGSTYNVFGNKFCKVIQHMENGDFVQAQELFAKLFDAIKILASDGNYKVTLRRTTNRTLLAKYGSTLGDEYKCQFILENDEQTADQLIDSVKAKYPDLLEF